MAPPSPLVESCPLAPPRGDWGRVLIIAIACSFLAGTSSSALLLAVWWHHASGSEAFDAFARNQQQMLDTFVEFKHTLNRTNVLAAMPSDSDRAVLYPELWKTLSDTDQKFFPRALQWAGRREPLTPSTRGPARPAP